MNNKIKTLADDFQIDLIRFLRDIIAIPSMNGDEGAVIERIKKEMEETGYEKVWVDPMGNLFGQLGDGKKILAIDGHTDTVDIGDRKNWKIDPFGAEMKNDIIYGRGACDQKGGIAAAIYAGKIIREIGIPEDITLLVVASVLEENYEGISWQYIVNENKILPDAVMLTEPTDLGIRIGQRGRLELKVRTEGISCHGSAPERGKNAIYMAAPIIKDIELLNSRLKNDNILGKGSITVTDISSTAPSLCAVADSATIHLDRRLTNGETLESALSEIKSLESCKTSKAQISVPEYTVKSYTGLEYPVRAYYPMWSLKKSNSLVKTAVNAFQSQFNEEPDIDNWIFSTNGVATMGLFDIPTIGFGPGFEKYAHTVDDQVSVEHMTKALEFYANFIHSWGCKNNS